MSKPEVDHIVAEIARRFRTFGGGRGGDNGVTFNPVAEALKDRPTMFVAGVDVRQVVEFVLSCDAQRVDGDPE